MGGDLTNENKKMITELRETALQITTITIGFQTLVPHRPKQTASTTTAILNIITELRDGYSFASQLEVISFYPH